MSEANSVDAAARDWSMQHIHHCACGGLGWVYANVPGDDILWGRAVPCICQRDAQAKAETERLWRLSGLSTASLTDRTFGKFDPDLCTPPESRQTMRAIKRVCEQYAAAPRGWLILVGRVGSGKTHLAQAIVRATLDAGRSAYMATMPDLLETLRAGYKDEKDTFDARFDMLAEVPLLVIDDLGAEKGTEWSREQLYRAVNRRYEERSPLVVTSNAHLSRMGDSVDARILSRLSEGAGQKDGWSRVIELPAADFRTRRA